MRDADKLIGEAGNILEDLLEDPKAPGTYLKEGR